MTIFTGSNFDRSGLPGWCYFSDELFDLESEELFRKHWQFVCHENEILEPGSYATINIVNERGLVVRGHDCKIRAFHNLCRHRGSRVVADQKGRCSKAIVCPYHGWSYNFDGSLRGVPNRDTFSGVNFHNLGLIPLEMEIWNGFVFVKFKKSDQPSLSCVLEKFNTEIAPFNIDKMIPVEGSEWSEILDANWKSVRDVDNEGYHVRQAHPSLFDLYGRNYVDEPYENGTSRSLGKFNDAPSKKWSVRGYRDILKKYNWLSLNKVQRNSWLYVGVFPNLVFGFYPESVIYYYEFPLSATKTVQKGGVLRHADETREMKAARYLSGRIDRDTGKEDQMLVVWASEATKSSAFTKIILSDLEFGVKTYHDHLRRVMPVLNLINPPVKGQLHIKNDQMLDA